MKKEFNKLENFMNGIAAAMQLALRAGENGFFIEYICLVSSIIDGLLRLCLILKRQLETNSEKIQYKFLYQSNEDKIIKERQVYKMALEKKVITQKLFNDLEHLYQQRNRVIHRYIISDISTMDVLKIGIQYEKISFFVIACVEKLEKEQVRRGVGMTRIDENKPNENLLSIINEMIKEKHSDSNLFCALAKKINE